MVLKERFVIAADNSHDMCLGHSPSSLHVCLVGTVVGAGAARVLDHSP